MEADVGSCGRVHRRGADAAWLAVQQVHRERRNTARGESLCFCYQLSELGEDILHHCTSFVCL